MEKYNKLVYIYNSKNKEKIENLSNAINDVKNNITESYFNYQETFMFNFDKIIISEQKNESLTQEEIDKELKEIKLPLTQEEIDKELKEISSTI